MTDTPVRPPTVRQRIASEVASGYPPEDIADALLAPAGPVAVIVAEALRDAADSLPCWCEHVSDYGVACLRHGTAYEHFADRADTIERKGIR